MMKQRTFHLNLAVLATGIMAFAGVLIETAMNVTFPTLLKQFQIETSEVQWVTTIYLLMIAIIVPLSSYLIKRYSIRQLFTAAIVLFIVGVLLNSLPSGFALLLFGRLLQGVATGISLPLMFNIILTKAPLERRGLMIGLGTLTTSIAPALGPTYGGLLTASLGWRYIYLLLLPVLLVTALLGLYAIPHEPTKSTGSINFVAASALAVFFSSFLISFSFIGRPLFWPLLMLAGAALIYFRHFNRKNPLIQLTLFQNRLFTVSLFAFITFQMILLGISFLLPNFVQEVTGLSASKAGMMMFPGALTGALFAPLAGRLLDRIGAKKPILSGMILALLGLGCLIWLLPFGKITGIICVHVLFMAGVGLSYSNLMSIGLSSLPVSENADGNAIFTTLQQFSGAVSTAGAAVLLSFFQKSNGDFQQGTTQGTLAGLWLFLGLLLVVTIAIWTVFHKENSLK